MFVIPFTTHQVAAAHRKWQREASGTEAQAEAVPEGNHELSLLRVEAERLRADNARLQAEFAALKERLGKSSSTPLERCREYIMAVRLNAHRLEAEVAALQALINERAGALPEPALVGYKGEPL